MQTSSLRKDLCLLFGSCAFSLNLLLAYIIYTVKCAHTGKYKWLLFLYTLSAMGTGASQIITTPHYFMNSNGFILYDSLRLLPPCIGDVVFLFYASCFFQNMVILTHCFIFRYYAVCNPDKLDNFMKHWPKLAIISVAILLAAIVAYQFYSGNRSPLIDDLMNSGFINYTGHSLMDTGYVCVLVYTNEGLNYNLVMVLGIFVVISLIAAAIMTTLAVIIAKTLKRNKSTSKIVANHQKRIFILLLYQLFLPVIFNVCPQEFIILSAYFHINSRDIVHQLCCSLTVAQVIDPLMTFYLMKSYRIGLLKKLNMIRIKDIRGLFTESVIPPEQ